MIYIRELFIRVVAPVSYMTKVFEFSLVASTLLERMCCPGWNCGGADDRTTRALADEVDDGLQAQRAMVNSYDVQTKLLNEYLKSKKYQESDDTKKSNGRFLGRKGALLVCRGRAGVPTAACLCIPQERVDTCSR